MQNKIYKSAIAICFCLLSVNQIKGQTIAVYNIDVLTTPTVWDQKSIYGSTDPVIADAVAKTLAMEISSDLASILKEKKNYSSVKINMPENGPGFKRAITESTGNSLKYLPFSGFKEAKKVFSGNDELMEVKFEFNNLGSASNMIVMEKVKKAGYIYYNVEVTIQSKNSNGEIIKDKKITCIDFSEALSGSVQDNKKYKVECDGQFTKDIVLKSIHYAFTKALSEQ